MKKNLLTTILTMGTLLLLLSGGVLGQDTSNDYALNSATNGGCFRINDDAALDVVGDFTVEAWVYITENTSTSRFIIDRINVFQFYISSSAVLFNLNEAVGNTVSTGTISLNVWHHIAVVGSGGSTTIYTDGTAGQSELNALVVESEDCYIGGQGGWFSGSPTSLIDEVRFSNSALYTSNFTPSTNSPLGTNANTVFYFQFEVNSELPPLDDGPLSLATTNGQADNTNLIISGNYVTAPTGLPLPVELTKFEATSTSSATVVLEWATATEINNYGFEIERAVADNFETIGFVEGAGNSNSPKQYSFVDTDNLSGSVSYRLKQVDTDGGFEYSDVVTVNASGLAKTELFQNYPNPFNPTTQISFKLANANQVNVSVYNTLGEKVAELVNEVRDAGIHNVKFDASNLSSGFYIYRIETPNYSKTMKMLLLK